MGPRELIQRLGLKPHPEGGQYREVFRSEHRVSVPATGADRAALTAIHYLLCEGERSRWHRVRSDEVWHHADGSPLELLLLSPDLVELRRMTLGSLANGHTPMVVVPAFWWQAARPLGPYALCSCLVAPGFDFADFTFMHDEDDRARLAERHPAMIEFL
jgi:predicted cupin superfamily sugar epimerase